MELSRDEIRLALPSKGRLAAEALELLAAAGLAVHKPNPRQYMATIPRLPALTVLFQRASDIAISVRDGSVDFGITGLDVVSEQQGDDGRVLILLEDLGFGACRLCAIVPEAWSNVHEMAHLKDVRRTLERPLRVATKFPVLTKRFFGEFGYDDTQLIAAEGTLEIAPDIGYADMIVDLVSTGTTLRDNRLRSLDDGLILSSQACLIANKARLQARPGVLAVAKQLLEFVVAHLRADENVVVAANVRGRSPRELAEQMFTMEVIGGLQGPTIAPVFTRDGGDWHAVNIVVQKRQLSQAIGELRQIGGSGVVVTPVNYIFEEEPPAYRRMLAALEE
ncbi:MAG: ATP phosphoribosyltransferase [Candidatus Promineifilaceae bacterium]|nr:ATP phosphoribosyltransferase [Candidatus Promineifilaceae bacterium]